MLFPKLNIRNKIEKPSGLARLQRISPTSSSYTPSYTGLLCMFKTARYFFSPLGPSTFRCLLGCSFWSYLCIWLFTRAIRSHLSLCGLSVTLRTPTVRTLYSPNGLQVPTAACSVPHPTQHSEQQACESRASHITTELFSSHGILSMYLILLPIWCFLLQYTVITTICFQVLKQCLVLLHSKRSVSSWSHSNKSILCICVFIYVASLSQFTVFSFGLISIFLIL